MLSETWTLKAASHAGASTVGLFAATGPAGPGYLKLRPIGVTGYATGSMRPSPPFFRR